MPPPDDVTRLRHILDSAKKAIQFAQNKSRDDLETDELLNLALLRLLEIVGEAASGISESMRARYPQIPWRQMSDTRNRLIHGYFDVETDQVWDTVTKELPPLIAEVENVLRKEIKEPP